MLERFLAVDPFAAKYPSWSPYAYTLNNPLKYVNPDGMDSEQAQQLNQALEGFRAWDTPDAASDPSPGQLGHSTDRRAQ